jgi:hypothetical protein
MIKNKVEFTSSTLWLLPMFGASISEWKRAGFLNAYLVDDIMKERQYAGLTVRLLFKSSEENCLLLEDIIMILDSLVLDLYGINKEFVVLVLKVPDEFEDDYYRILQGKYSELSQVYRDMVSDKTRTNNYSYDKKVGKRLQLLVMDNDKLVKKVASQVIQDMSNVAEGQCWEIPVMANETISAELIKQLQQNG